APLHTKAPRERRGRRDVEIEPRAVEIARGELERREFADDRDVTVHVRAGTRAKRRHGCIGFRQLAPTDAPDRRAHPVVLDLAHDADRAALARYDIPLVPEPPDAPADIGCGNAGEGPAAEVDGVLERRRLLVMHAHVTDPEPVLPRRLQDDTE